MKCPDCEHSIDDDATVCPHCGAIILVLAESSENPYATPMDHSQESPPSYVGQGDGQNSDGTFGGLIPVKNPKALVAYYLAVASLFPFFGFPIGLAAFGFGIAGLKARKKNPEVKGAAHAWIGIGCGGLFAIIWGAAIVLGVIAIINA